MYAPKPIGWRLLFTDQVRPHCLIAPTLSCAPQDGTSDLGLLRVAEAARLSIALQFTLFFVLLHSVSLCVDVFAVACSLPSFALASSKRFNPAPLV